MSKLTSAERPKGVTDLKHQDTSARYSGFFWGLHIAPLPQCPQAVALLGATQPCAAPTDDLSQLYKWET